MRLTEEFGDMVSAAAAQAGDRHANAFARNVGNLGTGHGAGCRGAKDEDPAVHV